jgi:kindlin 2
VNAGIRHPEEVSFCKPLDPNHLKYNLKDLPGNKKRHSDPRGGPNNGLPPADTNTFIANSSPSGSTGSLDKSSPPFMCAPVTPTRHHTSTPISSPVGTVSPYSAFSSLACSHLSSKMMSQTHCTPRNIFIVIP